MTAGLAVVAAEVLDRALSSGGVQTRKLCGSHLAGEVRILGEVLEVPAVERVAVDIHARAKQAVHLICVHFKPHECKQLRHERAVKRGGKQRSVRQTERLRATVEAHSGRTVVAACAGDTQRGQRI